MLSPLNFQKMCQGKRILLVITRLDAGGSADVTLRLAAGLRRCGCEVFLISGKTVEPACDLAKFAKQNGFHLIFVPALVRQINLLLDSLAFIHLLRWIKRLKPAVLHTNTSKAGFLGRLAGYVARVPRIVHSDHGHIFYGYYSPSLTLFFIVLEKLAAHWCHLILTLTESGRQDYLKARIAPANKFRVSSGGTDLQPFFKVKARPPQIPTANDPLRVIWVGRLVPVKNLPLLLRAVAILQNDNFPSEYWVVGDGNERESSEILARQLRLDKVTFWGFRRDMPQLLAQCDLFVFTSLNEGFGNVIVEAMASGLPVVGPAVGGTPDLITNGVNGILIPSDDAPALVAAIKKLGMNPELRRRMAAENRKKAAFYTIDNYIYRVTNAYFNG